MRSALRRSTIGLAVMSGVALLAGCGAKPQEPVEQVVVRAPGAASVTASGAMPAPAATDLIATGKAAVATTCLGCHAVDAGAPAKIGPNLHDVVGRKAGSLAGFGYSGAMKASGITWSEAELDRFLTDPGARVPGTLMAIGGIRDASTRKAIVAYLASIGPRR